MSIKLMNLVWEYSGNSGSTLLVLLALADHANDEGICWPAIPRIAKRGRVSERQALRILGDLQASSELQVIERGGGKGHPNIYRVTPVTGFVEETSPTDTVTPMSGFANETVTPASPKGDIQGSKGDAHDGGTTIKNNHHSEPPQEQSRAGLSKAEQDAARKTLEEHFKVLTSLTVPPSKKEAGELWWVPLREVCALVDWVPGVGMDLLAACVQRAKQNRTEVASPKSIIKYARGIRAAQLRGEPIGLGGNGRPGNARQGYDPVADMVAFKNKRGLK